MKISRKNTPSAPRSFLPYQSEWNGYRKFLGKPDGKHIAISQAHEIFQRAKSRGSLPNQHSEDQREKRDAQWIGTKNGARNRKGNSSRSVWYPELDDIAKKYGYAYAFYDRKQFYMFKIREMFERCQVRGSIPKYRSEDPQEKKDYTFVCNRREAKKNRKDFWHCEYDKIAEEYGYPKIFDKQNRKQEAIDMAHNVFGRARSKGSLPNCSTKDLQEKKDRSWILVKRKARRGSKDYAWYPELDQIAKEYGFPNVFNQLGKKEKAVDKCIAVFERIKTKGKIPKRSGSCEQERKDASFISRIRRAKRGKGTTVWYTEFDDVAKRYGYEGVFDRKK